MTQTELSLAEAQPAGLCNVPGQQRHGGEKHSSLCNIFQSQYNFYKEGTLCVKYDREERHSIKSWMFYFQNFLATMEVLPLLVPDLTSYNTPPFSHYFYYTFCSALFSSQYYQNLIYFCLSQLKQHVIPTKEEDLAIWFTTGCRTELVCAKCSLSLSLYIYIYNICYI